MEAIAAFPAMARAVMNCSDGPENTYCTIASTTTLILNQSFLLVYLMIIELRDNRL